MTGSTTTAKSRFFDSSFNNFATSSTHSALGNIPVFTAVTGKKSITCRN